MALSFKEINRDSAYVHDVENIFRISFPRRTAVSMEDFFRMKAQGNFDFQAIFDGDDLVGFYNALVSDSITYLFFFAIDSDARSRGYGSRVLSLLPDQYPDRIQILDMERVDPEADNYDQRCRRRDFYEKNGYYDSGYQISYFGEVFTLMTKASFPMDDLEQLLNTADLEAFDPQIIHS